MLRSAGWLITDAPEAGNTLGIAVRQFQVGQTVADYALFVDRQLVALVEAKGGGLPAQVVARQVEHLTGELASAGPDTTITARAAPFFYISNGKETIFISGGDAQTSRDVFHFHRPKTLSHWAREPSLHNR
jgi:type I restriction enzyme, R subunit